jgi:ornithine decarboxylase
MMGNIFKFETVHSVHPGALPEYRNTREVLEQLKPEDPVYLFNRDHLAQRATDFQTDFPGTVSYAVKANTRNRVLRTLIQYGICNFDVASVAEIRRLMALNPNLKIHFNNPIKSEGSIASAYHEYGVRSFALDDASELEKIIRACADPSQLMLSVRFKLARHQASYDFGSKFGATPRQATGLLKAIKKAGAQAALTFHPGSQCTDPNEYRRYIHAAGEISTTAKLRLAQLNVGGGFPEYYVNTSAEPRLHYFDAIRCAVGDAFKDDLPMIMCEPGRAMVASSISLLCRVIHVREDTRTAFINDGIYGGLQEQCLTDLRLPVQLWRDEKRVRSELTAFTVFGPTCDPVDRLPRTLELPADLRTGDYLELGLVGAYGSATATMFNGFDSQRYINVREG